MRFIEIFLGLLMFLSCIQDPAGFEKKSTEKISKDIDTLFNSWAQFAEVDNWWGYLGDGWYKAPTFMTCDHIFDDDKYLFYEYSYLNFSTKIKTKTNPYIFSVSILTNNYTAQNMAVFADTIDYGDSLEITHRIQLDSIVCISGVIMPIDSINYILIDIVRTDGLPTPNSNEYSYYELTVTGE